LLLLEPGRRNRMSAENTDASADSGQLRAVPDVGAVLAGNFVLLILRPA
jgi:hypothetical protein